MQEESGCGWTIILREDDVGHSRFKRAWDALSDDAQLELLEHLKVAEGIGPDPDSARAVFTEERRSYTAYIERSQRYRCVLFLAECAATRRIFVLDLCVDNGDGDFALSQRLVRETTIALGLRKPAIEYLR